jgi:hypothetical protein
LAIAGLTLKLWCGYGNISPGGPIFDFERRLKNALANICSLCKTESKKMTIHLQVNKKDSYLQNVFVDATKNLRWRNGRSHKLFILSCYIDFKAIKNLIVKLKDELPIIKIGLAFEFYEAFRSRRPNETKKELESLEKWCNKQEIKFEWRAIRAGALMHAKGYALVQVLEGGYGDGIVCVGSGNATFPGLGQRKHNGMQRSNVELFQISINGNEVIEFLNIWNQLEEYERNLDAASSKADDYEFAYMLLASGVFLHDWRDSLRSKVGIKYTLTPEGGKAISVDEELKRLGLNVDMATMTRNPLVTVDFSLTRSMPSSFTRMYTVDSLMGRWCPRSIWSIVEENIEVDVDFNKFLKSFINATEPEKLNACAEEEEKISCRLVERGIVTLVERRIESWVEKIRELRENEDMLKRIFLKFESFDLPYDFSAREEVTNLHESLVETLAIKNNMSFIAEKIATSESMRDLSCLDLNANQKNNLVKLLESVGENN